jgi:hypothetical protein
MTLFVALNNLLSVSAIFFSTIVDQALLSDLAWTGDYLKRENKENKSQHHDLSSNRCCSIGAYSV